MMELLVSIAVLGVVAIGFLGALMAGYRSVRVANDHTLAESLTRTAMENVAASDAFPVPHQEYSNGRLDVVIDGEYIDAGHVVSQSPTQLQMITVTIRYPDNGPAIKSTQCVKAKP